MKDLKYLEINFNLWFFEQLFQNEIASNYFGLFFSHKIFLKQSSSPNTFDHGLVFHQGISISITKNKASSSRGLTTYKMNDLFKVYLYSKKVH